MRTGDLNSLPKQMAGSDLTPSERLILLDLALATGPDGTCFMGAPRQTKRTGLSTGHIRRLRLSLSAKGWISIENVPGRSSRITILGVRASAQGGVRAGAQVGTRRRVGGCAPALPVPSNTSSNTPAWDSQYIPDNGVGVLSNGQRAAFFEQYRKQRTATEQGGSV